MSPPGTESRDREKDGCHVGQRRLTLLHNQHQSETRKTQRSQSESFDREVIRAEREN